MNSGSCSAWLRNPGAGAAGKTRNPVRRSTDDLVRVLKAILGGVVLLAVVNYFRNDSLSLMLALRPA